MLRTVIAAAFKSKGKKNLSRSELNYILSFDLKWFTHEKSKELVNVSLKKGLLKEENEMLQPAFDIHKVEVPLGFKPELKKIITSNTFDEIVWELASKTGKEVVEITAMINSMQERLSNILDLSVVALILAKQYGIEIDSYIDKVWSDLIRKGDGEVVG